MAKKVQRENIKASPTIVGVALNIVRQSENKHKTTALARYRYINITTDRLNLCKNDMYSIHRFTHKVIPYTKRFFSRDDNR